ncbi:hypothetical protein M407DRAFT_33041 [Tulasnella calospora MUT 4182]|uniref:Uncharacterized protein n=1 Tax=Tulasnella calospora MUT 4182 TaxID=1051891 RepID=A0A0C3Q2Q1_9AGAM|nr:hypothetical protein M407DRAFT_33215 [Tulasnella calospora MUT 4182]KIO17306.1 hypothetical protein M407DRAFT_33041 [Tulasnella calospora MUT 4182]
MPPRDEPSEGDRFTSNFEYGQCGADGVGTFGLDLYGLIGDTAKCARTASVTLRKGAAIHEDKLKIISALLAPITSSGPIAPTASVPLGPTPFFNLTPSATLNQTAHPACSHQRPRLSQQRNSNSSSKSGNTKMGNSRPGSPLALGTDGTSTNTNQSTTQDLIANPTSTLNYFSPFHIPGYLDSQEKHLNDGRRNRYPHLVLSGIRTAFLDRWILTHVLQCRRSENDRQIATPLSLFASDNTGE